MVLRGLNYAFFSPISLDAPVAHCFEIRSTAGMADFGISAGQFVAVVWDKSSPTDALKDLVVKLQAVTGREGRVSVENISQLLQCKYLPRLSYRVGGGWKWVGLYGTAAFLLFPDN